MRSIKKTLTIVALLILAINANAYPWLSPYSYCMNNPVKFIDPDGRAPGDFFKSIDKAAIDFGQFYNDNSIRDNKEYSSYIFKIKDTEGNIGFTYSLANIGNNESVHYGIMKILIFFRYQNKYT